MCGDGACQNGAWVVGVAKSGRELGCDLIGQSCIIAPTGEIVAMCTTLGDEVVVVDCDLNRCSVIQENVMEVLCASAQRAPMRILPRTVIRVRLPTEPEGSLFLLDSVPGTW